MAEVPAIHGDCDPRFARVREEFARNFAERGDVGAAVSIVLDGAPVVDLWAGWRDAARTQPWERDTIVPCWSVGKAMSAIALLRQVDAGLVDLDAPVTRYWPEFGQAGKERIPVRMLLTHQSGLPAIAKPMAPGIHLTSWETMVHAIEEQAPWWEPGTKHGYHVNTMGFLVGEVVRRVTGRRIRDVIAEDVAGPLDAEFIVGTTPADDARTADWLAYEPQAGEDRNERRPWMAVEAGQESPRDLMRKLTYSNPAATPGGVSSRAWRAAEFPSTNGHSNARSIARIFGALARGGTASNGWRVLDGATVEAAARTYADGEDEVLGRPTRFGLGFQLTIPGIRPLGPNPGAFGHYGNGALVGFADPVAGLAFAFTCNQSGRSWRDPRNIALVDRTYECLG
ncbi:MAG: class A beta-lactamase-related serine hydrolase [Dehalococcoidia bacterium]|nr:MAG: class A beta-lactamase-related serine hydrolase [Dehalococcoidia bacterium]